MHPESGLTAGQQKHLTTTMNNEAAYTELVEHVQDALALLVHSELGLGQLRGADDET